MLNKPPKLIDLAVAFGGHQLHLACGQLGVNSVAVRLRGRGRNQPQALVVAGHAAATAGERLCRSLNQGQAGKHAFLDHS
jgi:hypothetical protein